MHRKPVCAAALLRRCLPAATLWVVSAAALSAHAAATPTEWVGTWATAPYAASQNVPTVVDSTLRQIVHTSIAGKELRIRFTNEFGTEPLRIDAATVALSTSGDAVDAGSLHTLTFGGQPGISIPPGALAVSDPVTMATPAFANLAISTYLPLQQISTASFHNDAAQENYIQTGNQVSAPGLNAATRVESWYFIKGVDVEPATSHAAAVVAFGDSITDGAYATLDENHRWPDYFAQRLHNNPATADLSVLNEGIGGNRVLRDGTGPSALARFDRDVLAQPGAKYVIVLESINDIGRLARANDPEDNVTAQDLEQGLAQLVARAHEHGLKIFGATLTPYQGAKYYTEKGEQIREAINQWIRSSGVFDGVIDFDKATRDQSNPLVYAPAYDSGDHLHPKDAGYSAMADSIDLSLFH